MTAPSAVTVAGFAKVFFYRDIEAGSEALDMNPETFKSTYLMLNNEGGYNTVNTLCDFFQEDGSFLLGDKNPKNCVVFPFTAQPDRMFILLSIIGSSAVCPVVYEILERLKTEYRFVYHPRKRK